MVAILSDKISLHVIRVFFTSIHTLTIVFTNWSPVKILAQIIQLNKKCVWGFKNPIGGFQDFIIFPKLEVVYKLGYSFLSHKCDLFMSLELSSFFSNWNSLSTSLFEFQKIHHISETEIHNASTIHFTTKPTQDLYPVYCIHVENFKIQRMRNELSGLTCGGFLKRMGFGQKQDQSVPKLYFQDHFQDDFLRNGHSIYNRIITRMTIGQ